MDPSKVEIHTGSIDQPHKVVGQIQAKRSKGSAFSSDPTLEEVNSELRQKAAECNATAVIDVQYKRGMSMFSCGVLTATGTAVILESEEKTWPLLRREDQTCGEGLQALWKRSA